MLNVAKAAPPTLPGSAPGVTDDPDGPVGFAPAHLPLLGFDPSTLRVPAGPPEWAVRLLVLIAACALFLPHLGSFGLWDPWETHYGEVTRYMIETHDWVHPWWGYKGEKIGGDPGPGENFWSKPILLFWMEAATIKTIGLSELAIRLPVALVTILAVFMTYVCVAHLLGRKKGLLAALVLATCPQWAQVSRQSQTDMPFVAMLTVAMVTFAVAAFARPKETSDRGIWARLTFMTLFLLGLVLPQLFIVIADVKHALPVGPDGRTSAFDQWRMTGLFQALTFCVVLVPLLISMWAPALTHWREHGGRFTPEQRDELWRKCYLWLFYAFCGLALMGKGLLGFALPGAILFVYLLLSGEWSLLLQRRPDGQGWRGRVELWRGIAIFVCVGFPWYVGLLSGPDGAGFYARFFIHDHFNRLGAGVHELDDGTFEHFWKWLGFGTWPWVAFMPVALVPLVRLRLADKSPESRLRLFLFLWYFIAYVLFTLSQTKFHHYIFPALPPLALLTAWGLHDLLADRTTMSRMLVAAGIGLFAVVSWDISHEPQHFRNQYTYKYDREYPSDEQRPIDRNARIEYSPGDDFEPKKTWAEGEFYKHTPASLHAVLNVRAFRFETFIPAMAALGGLGLLLMLFRSRLRAVGLGLVGLQGALGAAWTLNYYMPSLAPHWSQKYLFERYYDTCVRAKNPPDIEEAFTPLIAGTSLEEFFAPQGKRVCEEEVISWLLTWRGETYYSNNVIRPLLKENTQFEPYMKELNRGARFYIHIERSRMKQVKSKLDAFAKKETGNPHFRGIKDYNVTLEHGENYWFVLLKADPVCKDGFTQDRVGRCLPVSAQRD